MIRRSVHGAAAAAAIFLLLMTAGTILAGGSAEIRIDAAGTTEPPRSGDPVVIGFTVLQHGETPAGWVHPAITFRNIATSEEVVAVGKPSGADGHFTATATLPSAGHWSFNVAMPELLTESPPTIIAVHTADGRAPVLDPTTLLAAIERNRVDIRQEVTDELYGRLDAVGAQLGGLDTLARRTAQRQDELSSQIATLTAERDALAARLGESGNAGSGPMSFLATITVAVLAGAVAGFAMVWLGRRPEPRQPLEREPGVSLDPAREGSPRG